MEFVDGVLVCVMDIVVVFCIGVFFMLLFGIDFVFLCVLCLECMLLDCGGIVIVVELDCMFECMWMKLFKWVLQVDDFLEGVYVKFDGCFVYVVGVEGGVYCM